jgi:DNA-directed RNA polymerase specialized sigma subunit
MKIDKSIYSALEKILHIQRLLKEKLNRVPTIDELSKECELDSKHVAKVLVAADGFGCS